MKLLLSVLDLAPVSSGSTPSEALRNTLELARLADRLGFIRYWFAEHHNIPSVASSSPAVLIEHVAPARSPRRRTVADLYATGSPSITTFPASPARLPRC